MREVLNKLLCTMIITLLFLCRSLLHFFFPSLAALFLKGNKPDKECRAYNFDVARIGAAYPSAAPSSKPTMSAIPSVAPTSQPSHEPSSPRPSTLMWSQLYNDLTGEASYDYFGSACAISADGSRHIVGVVGHSGYTGQVRVYRDTGDSWEQVHAPLNGDASYDGFGRAVGISEDGSWIIVSAVGANKVKVFRDNGSS